MTQDRELPGWPAKRLVKEVRSHLWRFGIRPKRDGDAWRATWEWARGIADSYYHSRWPTATQIATQYMLLLLLEMRSSAMLRLAPRAREHAPAYMLQKAAEICSLAAPTDLPMIEDE